jgi:hypothetical protein
LGAGKREASFATPEKIPNADASYWVSIFFAASLLLLRCACAAAKKPAQKMPQKSKEIAKDFSRLLSDNPAGDIDSRYMKTGSC